MFASRCFFSQREGGNWWGKTEGGVFLPLTTREMGIRSGGWTSLPPSGRNRLNKRQQNDYPLPQLANDADQAGQDISNCMVSNEFSLSDSSLISRPRNVLRGRPF